MSDANPDDQHPKVVEAAVEASGAAEAPAEKPEGGSNKVDFLVHVKHTCDECHLSPILGKRYKSAVRSNYDLCARCFGAYDGPDIGLKEEVLARDQKHSSGFVLKLKIKNGEDEQVRRISVADIWGKRIGHLSFKKMMAIASSYASSGDEKVDDAGLAAFLAQAKATYIDEDGDKITLSSNAELEDAFRQTLKKFPAERKPFRITVNVAEEAPKVVCARGPQNRNAMGMPQQQIRLPNRAGKLVFVPNKRMARKAFCMPKENSPKFDKEFFIHARHTCDGCSKTPIIGTRHHATKIPDFDLCDACFKNYDGEDLDFKPEIQDRDRRMQHKWLRKHLANTSENIAAVWNKANGDLAEFLRKVQESGATIESATVYGCPAAAAAAAQKAPEAEDSGEKKPAAKDSDKEAAAKESATDKKAPGSPDANHDESFLSDADGNGSIAKAIGRTLDVCVAAIEDAMEENAAAASGKEEAPSANKTTDDVAAAAAAVAVDTFSVASSMISSMTDVLKKMEEAKVADNASQSGVDVATSTDVPSVVTGATILKSEDGTAKKAEVPLVEDASDGEDEWSVVDDDKAKEETELIHVSEPCQGFKGKVDFIHVSEPCQGYSKLPEAKDEDGDKSLTSTEPLSPVLLAKWDTELHQLHELGFLDDRKNVDVLESLEAAHVGVGSEEKVTINAAIGRLLGERR